MLLKPFLEDKNTFGMHLDPREIFQLLGVQCLESFLIRGRGALQIGYRTLDLKASFFQLFGQPLLPLQMVLDQDVLTEMNLRRYLPLRTKIHSIQAEFTVNPTADDISFFRFQGHFTVALNGTAQTGIGKVNAALTAEILIREYGVDAIIFTGVAGGINPELNIGDIVIAERVVHHDYGQITPATFIPWDTVGFLADSFLVAITAQAAENVTFDSIPQKIRKKVTYFPRVIIGRVTTGDQFIASEEKREWIEKTFRADCVEMEGASVAQVCMVNEVPFVIIRCLSDLANEKADIDFEAFVNYAAKNSNVIVKEIINLLEK